MVEFQSSARDYPPVSPIKQTLRKTFVGLWGVAVTRGNLLQVHQLISFQRKYIESRQILSSLTISDSNFGKPFIGDVFSFSKLIVKHGKERL